MRYIFKRIYNNFLMPSRIDDYEKIIKTAKDNGYEFHSVRSFESVKDHIDPQRKYLVLRCDVDTPDYKTLRNFLNIEYKYGAASSYYFRLSTVNYQFMREVERKGGEASYHYEEIATYCYEKRIKNKLLIDANLADIQSIFINNYNSFKEKSRLPCLIVASHGEFVNVRLGIPNKYLINNEIKFELGIIREAYDDEHINKLTCRIADHSSQFFIEEAINAIENGENVLELLIHPRQWRSAGWINFKMDFIRFYKEMLYRYF